MILNFEPQSLMGFRCRALLLALLATSLSSPQQANAGNLPATVRVVGAPAPIVPDARPCERDDLVDAPARMFRDANGQLVLFASHFINRALRGASFDELKKDCTVAFRGSDKPRASQFDARGWIISTWTEDGRDVAAIIHNEFQGHRFPGACEFRTYFACWYSFITLAKSTNGGKTFERTSRTGPIAGIGEPAEHGEPRARGFFGASNMIKMEDFVYTVTMTTGAGPQRRGNCLMRAKDPFDEKSWQILTEKGFESSISNVYEGRKPPVCKIVHNLVGDILSVVQHERTQTYLALSFPPGGKHKGSLTFSRSTNLMEWSAPEPIIEIPSQFSPGCQTERYMYPVLLDPASRSRNFDTVGDEAYLIMMHARLGRCTELLDRKLVKWKIEIR